MTIKAHLHKFMYEKMAHNLPILSRLFNGCGYGNTNPNPKPDPNTPNIIFHRNSVLAAIIIRAKMTAQADYIISILSKSSCTNLTNQKLCHMR